MEEVEGHANGKNVPERPKYGKGDYGADVLEELDLAAT
jgi:hypothetical protein